MPTPLSNPLRNRRSRRFWLWGATICVAGLTLAASAQLQPFVENPNPNSPVNVSPDNSAPAQPAFQMQSPPGAWDRFWQIEKVSDEDEWTRHFRIGAIVGLNISANFTTKGTFTLPGNNAANGIYDDGYVRVDDTGNAQGYTSYWGYNNASQLNGSTLTMHSTTSYTTSSSSEERSEFPGFELAYGGNIWAWGKARIGWEFGFGLLPISITDSSPMAANVSQNVYTFNTGGIVVPTAPYQGGSSGIGPTIIAAPTSVTSTNISSGTVSGSHKLDVMLYTFRLGPSVYWDLSEKLGLAVGGGPALGLVSGSYKYNETVTANGTSIKNSGQIDSTDVVYGGYVNATLTYHIEDHGDFYVGVQYMPLGNATISSGGREAELKLGGQVYITAGINWPF